MFLWIYFAKKEVQVTETDTFLLETEFDYFNYL